MALNNCVHSGRQNTQHPSTLLGNIIDEFFPHTQNQTTHMHAHTHTRSCNWWQRNLQPLSSKASMLARCWDQCVCFIKTVRTHTVCHIYMTSWYINLSITLENKQKCTKRIVFESSNYFCQKCNVFTHLFVHWLGGFNVYILTKYGMWIEKKPNDIHDFLYNDLN